MGIGGGVLPYLHMIFPVLPARLLRDFAKQWALSGMQGQCHSVRRYPSSSALISQSPVLSSFMSCLINSARSQPRRFCIILYLCPLIGMQWWFLQQQKKQQHRFLSLFGRIGEQVRRGSKYDVFRHF